MKSVNAYTKRIVLISNALEPPYDEGIKKFAHELNLALKTYKEIDALTLSIISSGSFLKRKLFLSWELFKTLRTFSPDVLIYIPTSGCTFFSLVRGWILKNVLSPKTRLILISLQPRGYSLLSRKLMPLLKPDMVFVQSGVTLQQLSAFGFDVVLIPSGVNINRFHPVSSKQKMVLRGKYNLDLNKSVVLHVGHINRNRNIQVLKELQRDNNQMLVVGSTSTEQDKDLVDKLRATGVRVVTDYLENIEEIYQLSDCYIFPVISDNASISFPLSVLEAMACNLPVISTRFGGLPYFLKEENGFFWADNPVEISEKIEIVKRLKEVDTRKIAEQFSWEQVVKRIEDATH